MSRALGLSRARRGFQRIKSAPLIGPENINKVVEIPAEEVDAVSPAKVSLMPKDLLKTLNEGEVLDLLAYLLSRGNPRDAMFSK